MGLLITKQEVIDLVFPRSNFDESLILEETVDVVQETYIRPKLGDDFYDEIIAENDGNTLTSVNQTLLDDHIKKAMAYFIKAETMVESAIDIASLGPRENLDDPLSQPASQQKFAMAKEQNMRLGNLKLDKMIRFMKDNSSDYPTWVRDQNNSGVYRKSGIITTRNKSPEFERLKDDNRINQRRIARDEDDLFC